MGSQPRYQRGSMPDVPAEQRLPDEELLSGGHYDYRGRRGPRLPGWEDLHPDIQEILVRLDEREAKALAAGLTILVRLEPADFARMKAIFKFIKIIYGIGWVIKWSMGTFLLGLGTVSLAGDQLIKIWGWITQILKFTPR